jgi:hypothetical protein
LYCAIQIAIYDAQGNTPVKKEMDVDLTERRAHALMMATDLNKGRGIDATKLIADAKQIEAFLTGQDQGPQPPPETKGDEIDASAVTDAIRAEDAQSE